VTASLTTGTVQAAASGGMISVLLAGQSTPVLVAVPRSIAPAVNDVVLVASDAASYVIAILGVAGGAVVPPTFGGVVVPPGSRGPEAVTPIRSATWRGGAWRGDTSDLFCGDYTSRGVNWGGAWYGSGFRGRGTLAAATATLVRGAGGIFAAQTPTMLLLAASDPPGAWAAPIATTAGPALSIGVPVGWAIPGGWLALLQSGGAGGIGIGQAGTTPYIHLSPPTITATFT